MEDQIAIWKSRELSYIRKKKSWREEGREIIFLMLY